MYIALVTKYKYGIKIILNVIQRWEVIAQINSFILAKLKETVTGSTWLLLHWNFNFPRKDKKMYILQITEVFATQICL